MTNTNATTDALAPATMPTIDADAGAGVQPLADRIKSAFDDALAALIAKRDQLYADAIAPLEQEGNILSAEYDELEAGIQAIEAVIPSKERLTQHEVDELLLSGKPDAKQATANKLAELRELRQKPAVMRQRQKEIIAKLEEIQAERHSVTRDMFDLWYTNTVQPTVRGGEKGLFGLLNGLAEDFTEFQSGCGMTRLDNRQRPLLTQAHIVNLTAPETSAEWIAGHHWYA